MDTRDLLQQTKERFAHNSAKSYLKEKYASKLMLADQGVFWKADLALISALASFDSDEIVCVDTFDKPIKVNRKKLLITLQTRYQTVMQEFYDEWSRVENIR